VKNKTLFFFILLCGAIIVTDIYMTPEHASEKKIHARIVVLLVLSVLYYLMTAYAKNILYEGNFYTILMFLGFLVASVTYLSLDKLGFIEPFKKKQKQQPETCENPIPTQTTKTERKTPSLVKPTKKKVKAPPKEQTPLTQ
jgi:hypothetical protein